MSSENIKTAGRTLDIFEAFARSNNGPMSLTELAKVILRRDRQHEIHRNHEVLRHYKLH
jgi:hypothetical protein